jgi:hypothetical protein
VREVLSVVLAWALASVGFYLLTPRPFYQSLLPALPALAVLAAWAVTRLGERLRGAAVRSAATALALVLLVAPVFSSLSLASRMPAARGQLATLGLLLDRLGPDDRVLSLTQAQVFFRSPLRAIGDSCGATMLDYDVDCVAARLSEAPPVAIIADQRVALLPPAIRALIQPHYVRAEQRGLLVPGAIVAPASEVEIELPLPGRYRAAGGGVRVDGVVVPEEGLVLRAGAHRASNRGDAPALLRRDLAPASLRN